MEGFARIMFTLATFYKSKEWTGLVEQLKIERTNENGELICEYCGKPITKKYDCIGHHEHELTEDNVNDVMISLNPKNIKLIHFKCHNKAHERWNGFYQRVYLVYGSPCSGKTSWVNEVANGDDLILDIDRIWDAICLDGWQHKTKRLNANVFGIRDCLLDMIRTRTGMWRNAYIIGGYPLRSDRDRLCDMLRATPIYIESTLDECLARAETKRPDDWKEYIIRWFENYVE